MSINVFYSLLELVELFLKKNNWRALYPEQQLSLTLRLVICIQSRMYFKIAWTIGLLMLFAESTLEVYCVLFYRIDSVYKRTETESVEC